VGTAITAEGSHRFILVCNTNELAGEVSMNGNCPALLIFATIYFSLPPRWSWPYSTTSAVVWLKIRDVEGHR
jgi:hypothetical protein